MMQLRIFLRLPVFTFFFFLPGLSGSASANPPDAADPKTESVAGPVKEPEKKSPQKEQPAKTSGAAANDAAGTGTPAILANSPPVKPATQAVQAAGDDDVVVIARKKRESSFSTTRSTDRVSRKRMQETAPRSVSEAVSETPGVFVQKTNHGGGAPILRGMIGPQVLITIDGVRLNHAAFRTGPLQYLNLFDPLVFESIEVLRGPGSVLYGSDAMGGVLRLNVVSLLSLAMSPRISLDGQFSGAWRSADAGLSGSLLLAAGGGGFAAGGVLSGLVAHDLRGGGDIGEQPHSSYSAATVFARGLWAPGRIGPFSALSVSANYLQGRLIDAGRADALYAKLNFLEYDNTDHLAWLKLDFELARTDLRGQLLFSFQRFYEQKDTSKVDSDYVTVLSTTRDRTWVSSPGFDLNLLWNAHPHLKIQSGGMFQSDTISSEQFSRDASQPWAPTGYVGLPDGSSARMWGAFVFADVPFSLLQITTTLSAGIRAHGSQSEAPAYSTLPQVRYDTNGLIFYASASAAWKKTWFSSLVFSQGFRAPSIHESAMLGDEGKAFHVPNPDLNPESLDSLEWVGRLHLPEFDLSAGAFLSRIHDIILRRKTTWQGQDQINGKDVVENYNGNEGYLTGLEGAFHWRPAKRLEVLGFANWTRGEEHRDDGTEVPMTRIPPLFGQLSLRTHARWQSGRIRFTAEGFARGALKQDRLSPEDESDVRIPEGGTPAWWTLNARAGLTVKRPAPGIEGISLFVTAENLLDAEYKIHGSGVYGPGRGVIVNFTADF